MIYLTLGTMGSGKSKTLINLYKDDELKKRRCNVTVYSNSETITSRNGKSLECIDYRGVTEFEGDCIYIDECQFLTDEQVEYIINDTRTVYHLFGLVNDFNGNMFKATAKLIQCAEGSTFKTNTCDVCKKKLATHHLLLNDKETLDKDKYKSVCYECWKKERKNELFRELNIRSGKMSKYKINANKILEILQKYDGQFYMEDNKLRLDYEHYQLPLNDEFIGHIKNKTICNGVRFTTNMIMTLLHEHFDECFEKIESSVKVGSCVEFLKDLNYPIEERNGKIYAITFKVYEQYEEAKVYDNVEKIVLALNGESVELSYSESTIYTLLKNNKDMLLEEE